MTTIGGYSNPFGQKNRSEIDKNDNLADDEEYINSVAENAVIISELIKK